MKRKRILAGNWKMHKTRIEARAFVHALIPQIKNAQCQIFIAPPFTSIADAACAAQNSSITIGAQNMHESQEGAFTGEISGAMLAEAGAKFVILGHSERRQLFFETNKAIQKKIISALQAQLQPILCIGETQDERKSGKTNAILSEQLSTCLDGIVTDQLILAYEPVWAIGTGNTATPEMTQEAHHFCRMWLLDHWGKEKAEKTRILYGGSVKPGTIAALCSMPDIDGALVGGAALQVDSFSQMANLLNQEVSP